MVDLADASTRPKPLFFWRLFFQHLLLGCKTAGEVTDLFSRVAKERKTLGPLISGLALFVRGSLGPWLATLGPQGGAPAGAGRKGGAAAGEGAGQGLTAEQCDELLRRVRAVERVLTASAAVSAALS